MSLSVQSNQERSSKRRRLHQRLRDLVLFAMLGTLMFCSKIIMELLPNIHLLGMLTMVFTVVFRAKALIPLYVYVMLNGLYSGFSMWWYPYLYIWTILWAITMLLPKDMSEKKAKIIYPLVCALHGLAFGTLYAPVQAIMFGFNLQQTVAWIISGFPFDVIHCIGNVFTGLLVFPFARLLKRLYLKSSI